MSSFGVLSTGFNRKKLSDLKASIEAGMRTAFGASIDQTADSVLGQVNGVNVGELDEVWQVAEAVYNGQFPDTSNGAALDAIAALTNSLRLSQTKSTMTVTCTGTPTTVLSIGRVVSVVASGARFISLAADTIAATAVWTISTAYAVDDRVTNGGNVYVATVAGTSAGAGGPTTEAEAIVDGTVTWRFLGNGTGDIDVAYGSETDFGPIAAPSSTLNIDTPVAGWDSAKNPLDAVLGRDIETDPAFRIRREADLQIQGSATVEAIAANLAALDEVLEVFVFENTSDFTDADGRPPHSIECVVETTDDTDVTIDQLVGDTIFSVKGKGAGIETFGFGIAPQKVTVAVVDSRGFAHTIFWTRVTDVDVFMDIDVTVDSAFYPVDGDDQVAAAIVAEGAKLGAGDTAIAEKIKCKAFDVSGVLDITLFEIDTIFPPVNTANLPFTSREIAKFDTSRVRVTSV